MPRSSGTSRGRSPSHATTTARRGGAAARRSRRPSRPAPLDRGTGECSRTLRPGGRGRRAAAPAPSAPAAARSRRGRRRRADSARASAQGSARAPPGSRRRPPQVRRRRPPCRRLGRCREPQAAGAPHRVGLAARGRQRQHLVERRLGRPVQRECRRHPDQRRRRRGAPARSRPTRSRRFGHWRPTQPDRASSTSTDAPPWASRSAQAQPVTPAPTTTTSAAASPSSGGNPSQGCSTCQSEGGADIALR